MNIRIFSSFSDKFYSWGYSTLKPHTTPITTLFIMFWNDIKCWVIFSKKISACEIVNPEISNFPCNAINLMKLQQKLHWHFSHDMSTLSTFNWHIRNLNNKHCTKLVCWALLWPWLPWIYFMRHKLGNTANIWMLNS